jgi:hypothetical protein
MDLISLSMLLVDELFCMYIVFVFSIFALFIFVINIIVAPLSVVSTRKPLIIKFEYTRVKKKNPKKLLQYKTHKNGFNHFI